jgi:hypothetical protein
MADGVDMQSAVVNYVETAALGCPPGAARPLWVAPYTSTTAITGAATVCLRPCEIRDRGGPERLRLADIFWQPAH